MDKSCESGILFRALCLISTLQTTEFQNSEYIRLFRAKFLAWVPVDTIAQLSSGKKSWESCGPFSQFWENHNKSGPDLKCGMPRASQLIQRVTRAALFAKIFGGFTRICKRYLGILVPYLGLPTTWRLPGRLQPLAALNNLGCVWLQCQTSIMT